MIDVDWAKCPIDVHSGGIDLKFPHHENEVAQSQGFYNQKEWCRFFLHTGHLEIDGKKMSKSLKNFTTIKEMLTTHEGIHLRYLCLLHKWDTTFNYVASSLEEAVAKNKQFTEFLLNMQVLKRTAGINMDQKMVEKDIDLQKYLETTRTQVHEALCDNFDTPKALDLLSALVVKTNSYIKDNSAVKIYLAQSASAYIEKMLSSFGCMLPTNKQESDITSSLLDVLSQFRAEVKQNASEKINIYKLCDKIRDVSLPEIGVRLEDTPKGSVWKIVGKEEAKKASVTEQKPKEKAKPKAKEQIKASEFFKSQADKYSKFDEEGIPTHDAKGKEISQELKNGFRKKMKKLMEKESKKTEQKKE